MFLFGKLDFEIKFFNGLFVCLNLRQPSALDLTGFAHPRELNYFLRIIYAYIFTQYVLYRLPL